MKKILDGLAAFGIVVGVVIACMLIWMFGMMFVCVIMISAFAAWALGVPVKVKTTKVIDGRRVTVYERYRRFTKL